MRYKIIAYIFAALVALGLAWQYSVNSDFKAQEKIVFDFYKPSAQRARAAQNPDALDEDQVTDELEIANLIAGFKNVVITFEENFRPFVNEPKSKDSPEIKALKKVLQERIRTNRIHVLSIPQIPEYPANQIILHTDDTSKNAFLLAKDILQTSVNAYLFGLLLEYKKEDIEFFYALRAFRNYYESQKLSIDGLFATWSPTLKEKFHTFKTDIWPTVAEFARYQNDIRQAKEWLIQNNAAELFI